MTPLSQYSTIALIDELRRREGDTHVYSPITPCDECAHYRVWKSLNQGHIDDYNPCSKGHSMQFRAPTSAGDACWGFYRPGCSDRLPCDIDTLRNPDNVAP